MTVKIKPDTRGTDALTGKVSDKVTELPAVIWEQIVAELGQIPEVPHIDPFDEQPWQLLPTMQELEELWSQAPLLERMLHEMAVSAHGDGEDLARYIAGQRALADMELVLKKGREDAADAGKTDVGGPGGAAAVASADASAGGVAVPRRPKNGDKMGDKDNKAVKRPHRRGSSKVPGGLGAGIAKGTVIDADEPTVAAAGP